MIKELKSNFEFKGSRNYVHSSTLLEDLNKIVYAHFYQENKWQMPKIDAQFHKEILANGLFKLSENITDLKSDKNVPAVFKFYDHQKSISAIFIEQSKMEVDRRIETKYSIKDMVANGDFSCTCEINCSSLKAYIENVIEANKRLHLITLKDKGSNLKILNLYMKNFPASFPVDKVKDPNRVLLEIKNISARNRNDSIATLNSFSFPAVDMDPFEIAYVVYGI